MSKFFSIVVALLLLAGVAWPQALDQRKAGMYVATEAGATCTQATLELADDAALALGYVLILPPVDRTGAACQWVISSNLTLDSPIYVPPKITTPVLKVNAGISLTLAKCPQIGQYQAWDADQSASGTVVFPSTGTCPTYPFLWSGGQIVGSMAYELLFNGVAFLRIDQSGVVTGAFGEIGSGELEDGEVSSLQKLSSNIYGIGTPDDTVSLAQHSNLLNIRPQTIDAATDTVDCGDWGPAVAEVTLLGGSFTLSSDPQIASGGAAHDCEVRVVAADSATDTLTIVDGAGTADPLGYDMPISLGVGILWRFRAGVWTHVYRSVLDGCLLNDGSGARVVGCGAAPFAFTTVDEEFIPVSWCNDGTAAPEVLATHGQVSYRAFDAALGEDVRCNWRVPGDWFDGASGAVKIKAVYLIVSVTTPTAGQGASWGLAGCSSGVGDTVDCTAGTEVNSETADLSGHIQWDVVEDAYTSITLTNLAAGEWVRLNLNRDVADAEDDYAQDLGLVGFVVKFYRMPGSLAY